jgi:hypothetical protein
MVSPSQLSKNQSGSSFSCAGKYMGVVKLLLLLLLLETNGLLLSPAASKEVALNDVGNDDEVANEVVVEWLQPRDSRFPPRTLSMRQAFLFSFLFVRMVTVMDRVVAVSEMGCERNLELPYGWFQNGTTVCK